MDTNLKERWKQICNEYALVFANKHGYDIKYELEHDYLWIADNPGTVCEMCDMFVGMEEMRYDIDNNIPEEQFEKWYWKSVEIYELTDKKWMNYESFCKGAPDYYTDEKLAEIRKSKQKVEDAKKEFQEMLDNLTKNN